MAKTPEKPKTAKTKTATEKKTTSAKSDTAKKKPTKKAADSQETATAKKTTTKKATSSRTTDPGAELAKQCQQVATKLDKMEGQQYQEIKEKLEWCLGSYNYDKNPEGLADYGKQAIEKLKDARQEKPRQVSQKLIDDLEKALSKF